MDKLLKRPSQIQPIETAGRFEKFKLTENPFPSEPVVNKDSTDKRINGGIYEIEIRKKEYGQISKSFLKIPQSNPTHLRLGFIIDTSYIGRGNGKSAFLINLQQMINKDYCLDISDDLNKCFAIYVAPEPGGRTKTFQSFVDLFFKSILGSNIIEYCLASLRLDAIYKIYPNINLDGDIKDDENKLISSLNSQEWLIKKGIDWTKLDALICGNEFLQDIPPNFPLFRGRTTLFHPFISQDNFKRHYIEQRKERDKYDFVFSYLIRFFQASGFNGAYVLVDDFERIPDFQSERQKKDFALELRLCLYDGIYVNAKIGFYNLILVLHAGVERLISDAWTGSGMENRAPLSPKTTSKHIIPFEKLSREHALLLIKKYLEEYRSEGGVEPIFPFNEEAIKTIGELSEYNAAKILKMSYDLLDKASEAEKLQIIDKKFVEENKMVQKETVDRSISTIEDEESTDLMKKAGIEE